MLPVREMLYYKADWGFHPAKNTQKGGKNQELEFEVPLFVAMYLIENI